MLTICSISSKKVLYSSSIFIPYPTYNFLQPYFTSFFIKVKVKKTNNIFSTQIINIFFFCLLGYHKLSTLSTKFKC